MPFDEIEDFQIAANLAEVFTRAQVTHDLNNDMAGRDTGRQHRVILPGAKDSAEQQKAKERFANLMFEILLQTLLDDPVYKARWELFGDFLATYSAAARTALDRAMDVAQAAHDAVREALHNAHNLDGQPIFDAGEGRFVYADGSEIDLADAERIIWNQKAISHADYLARVKAAKDADRTVTDIQLFQSELVKAEERRTSENNPYKSTEEMDADEQRLKRDAELLSQRPGVSFSVPDGQSQGISGAAMITLKN
ncbi:MAG: hypothetical protein AAF292_17810 [Pseudomonadota bacterium]